MDREKILQQLRARGYRITNQRRLIIDTMLEYECSCCKELYYETHKKDSSIGIATVYRIIKTLDEIGLIDRKIVCRMSCEEE